WRQGRRGDRWSVVSSPFETGRERRAIPSLSEPGRDPFRLGEDPHEVLTHDLADIGLRIPAALQLGADRGDLRDVLHSGGRLVDAVEIRAEAGGVDAGDFVDVVDVVDDDRVRDL